MSIFNSVFSKSSPHTQPAPRLQYAAEDFNVSQSLMEHMIEMEDLYFQITSEHMMATHIAMKDDDVDILTEGLKDFGNSAVQFFRRMLRKFKEFMQRIFMHMQALFGNFDKFLKKYRNEIKDLDPEFTIKGYDYSFDTSVPRLDKITQIIHEYNSEVQDVMKLSKKELMQQRSTFTSEENMGQIRAHVINHPQPLGVDEFGKRIKQIYRSGVEDTVDISVDKSLLMKTVEDYETLRTTLKECGRERDKTIMLVESLKDFFSRSASVHYSGQKKVAYTHTIQVNDNGSGINRTDKHEQEYTMKNMDVINTFYNFKWVQAKELGGISVTAVTEKVNALKEAVKQSQRIIRKALFAKKSKEEGE